MSVKWNNKDDRGFGFRESSLNLRKEFLACVDKSC